MRLSLVLSLLLVLCASPLSAHPLTDVRFDRSAAVRLSPQSVELTYTLEISSLALTLDAAKRLTPAEIAALDRTTIGLARAYARKAASEITDLFLVTVDGQRLPLQVTAIDVTMTDHALCRFSLRGAWPPGQRERKLVINDRTFLDRPGILNLTLDTKRGQDRPVEIVESEEPPAKLRTRPLAQFSREEELVARTATADILLPAAIAPQAPPSQSAPDTARPDPGDSTRTQSSGTSESEVSSSSSPSSGLLSDLAQRGLPALFDSPLGMGALLLAAFLFGAAHAFTPGHGKTLVAAYLIGERGTIRHAIALASVTTLTHTGSVIVVATVLWSVYGNDVPARMQGSLQFIAGMLVILVGLWLLLRRVSGQSDHFHFFGGHHHHGHGHHHHHADGHHHHHGHDYHHAHGSHGHGHDHGHSHDHSHDLADHHHEPTPAVARSSASWLRIVLMGVGGGIVPCWDAVLLLIAATALNRVGFAIPLLLAFSAGLGMVLVALGISVVTAYRLGAKRFEESRWFRFLPVVSAAFLIGVGFWLCQQAVRLTAQS